MRKGGGKSKGSGFERQVSRLVDVWWEEEPNTFWRTVVSGGWVEPGDITPRHRPGKPAIWFPFMIECKCVKGVDVLELLTDKKNPTLLKWWAQVTRERDDAVAQGRSIAETIRLVIFKRNNSPVFVMYETDDTLSNLPNPAILYMRKRLVVCTWDVFSSLFTKQAVYAKYDREYNNESDKKL
jgi:hypothetical protein